MKQMLITALLLFGLTACGLASPMFHVNVNTSGLSGGGQIQFQFAPGAAPDPATATLTSLSGAAFGKFAPTGDVVNPSGLNFVFGNTQALNQVILQVTSLGALLQYDLTFAGAAIDTPSSFDTTTFAMSLLDGSFLPLPGFGDPSFIIDIAQGGADAAVYDSLVTISQVPEPATFLIFGPLLVFFFLGSRTLRGHVPPFGTEVCGQRILIGRFRIPYR